MSSMPSLTWSANGYRVNGKPAFAVSGEFHYFRVPQADWRRRLELFKKAGGNAVATYIPWLLHEPTEGDIRFGDKPERDLEAFLRLCREMKLFVIARPGPYQYSELKYDGLPGWLCDGYPEILARDVHGKSFRPSSVSYHHPLFLEKARRWYEVVCPILAKYTLKQGGAIAFVQFDNELMGIHEWFSGWDYHPESMGFGRADGRYPQFLQAKYAEIAKLNAAYGTGFAAFADVRPFAASAPATLTELRRVKDYQDFYFAAIAELAETYVRWFRELGIDCDICHNSANPYMNGYFRETVAKLGPGFLLGSDHYYNLDMDWDQNNPTPKYATKVFYSCEQLRFLGMPPTAYELPGGSASDWPPVTPEDLACCYLTNVAFGMKGSNYYIFTGGPNPDGIGAFGDVYDFQASISATGEIRPTYRTEADFGRFLKKHAWLAAAERVADFHLGLDWNHCRGKYFPHCPEYEFTNHDAWTFFRKGMMITGLCASRAPNLVDLYSDDLLATTATPLLVATSVCMRADVQQRLIRFVQAGGRLLLAPVIPDRDEDFQPCTILRDFLGASKEKPWTPASPQLSVGPVRNVLVNGGLWHCDRLPAEATTIAIEDRSGTTCGWRRNVAGGGAVYWLGLRWKHGKDEHAAMLRHLLDLMGAAQPVVQCDNPNVWTSLRSDGQQSMLFVMNLFSAPMTATIQVPRAGQLPFAAGTFRLKPMAVKCVEVV